MSDISLHEAAEPTLPPMRTPAPPAPKPRPRTGQVAGAVLLLAVLAACMALALCLPRATPGEPWHASPAMFPALSILLCAGGALALLLQRLRRPPSGAWAAPVEDVPDDEIDATQSDPRRAGLGTLLLLLYPAAITVVGFAPATLAFVVAGTRVCGLSWRRGLLIGAVLAATLQVVFVWLFHVGLPTPWLLDWVGA